VRTVLAPSVLYYSTEEFIRAIKIIDYFYFLYGPVMTITLNQSVDQDDSESHVSYIIDEVFAKLPKSLALEAKDKGFMMRETHHGEKTIINLEVPGATDALNNAIKKLEKQVK
jgi:hypothetical protein